MTTPPRGVIVGRIFLDYEQWSGTDEEFEAELESEANLMMQQTREMRVRLLKNQLRPDEEAQEHDNDE